MNPARSAVRRLPIDPHAATAEDPNGASRLRAASLGLENAGILTGLALVTIVAAVLRFVRLSSVGFEIDEGFTMTYARQSWRGVLGFDGFYSPHPPLFYSFAKLANVFVPEMVASRTVAAIAGTATVPVVYALCARLADRRVALGAATLVAIAPFYVEYSRVGRMYTPVVLLAMVSYLAIVAFWQTGSRAWLVTYCAAIVLAVYTDYSAAYALAPLGVLLLFAFRADRQRGKALIAATAVAILAYLPWLPQVAATIERSSNATGRDDYLAASWENMRESALLIAGINARGSWDEAPHPSSWHRWPDHRTLLVLGCIAILALGVVALRRNPVALAFSLTFVFAVPLITIGASVISPGFAARTVMVAIIGVAIIASAFLTSKRLVRAERAVGLAGWCMLATMFVTAIPVSFDDGRASDWPNIVDQLDAYVYLGKPIAIFSTAGMLNDMIDLYDGDRLEDARFVTLLDGKRETWTGAERWLTRGVTLAQMRTGALDEVFPEGEPANDAIWFIRRFGGNEVARILTSMGYRQIGEIRNLDTNLELWARPGAVLGAPVDIGAGFAESGRWRISSSADLDPASANVLRLIDDRSRATISVPGEAGLYTLDVRIGRDSTESGRATIKCQSDQGDDLAKRTVTGAEFAPGAEWIDAAVAVFCPDGTSTVSIVLDRRGVESATFSTPRLQFAAPDGQLEGSSVAAS